LSKCFASDLKSKSLNTEATNEKSPFTTNKPFLYSEMAYSAVTPLPFHRIISAGQFNVNNINKMIAHYDAWHAQRRVNQLRSPDFQQTHDHADLSDLVAHIDQETAELEAAAFSLQMTIRRNQLLTAAILREEPIPWAETPRCICTCHHLPHPTDIPTYNPEVDRWEEAIPCQHGYAICAVCEGRESPQGWGRSDWPSPTSSETWVWVFF
jgi:hypothetical protein